MYILVDTDTMKVMAKHPNFQRLHEYGILCCSESAFVLPLEIDHIYKEFTDVQIQLMYINLTGNRQGATYARNVVSKILHYHLNALPETVINADVAQQADWAIAGDRQGECLYRPGSSVPNLGDEPHLSVCSDKEIEKTIVAQDPVPTNMGNQPAWAPQRETGAPATRVTSENGTASHTAGTATRSSGTRAIIYEVADRVWEEAGKPSDKSAILKLRKEMMSLLEAQGVKRNTSSNTLGNWQKDRIGI